MARTYPDRHDLERTRPVRTPLTIVVSLTLAALLALPAAALALATDSRGARASRFGREREQLGRWPRARLRRRARLNRRTRGSAPGGGRSEPASGAAAAVHTPLPGTRTPTASDRAATAPAASATTALPSASAAAAPDSAATDPASAVSAGSAVVVAAVLVLGAMVAAGFRARARLGRLG